VYYFWTNCPGCSCQIAVNWSSSVSGVTGSLRRWNSERTINDGRRFEAAGPEQGPFAVACVCGRELTASSQAQGGRRDPGLRVSLN
jgi:hypothetical protein